MKRFAFYSLVILSMCFAQSAIAQIPGVGKIKKALPKPELGVKLGGNFNQLHGGSFDNAYKPGVVVGAFAGVRKGKWGLRLEGLISSAKYQFSYTSTQNGTFKNIYLDVPLLLQYKLVNRLWVMIGPQYSYALSVTGSNLPANSPSDIKNYFVPSFAGVLGAEVRLPVHLVVGVRYILGVTNVNNESYSGLSGSWNARTIQAYVGFRFL